MDNQLEKIKTAASGLFYMSETDAPFEVIEFSETSIDEILQKIKKSSASVNHVEEQTLDYFFRIQIKEYPGQNAEDKERINKFKMLMETLKEVLSHIHVYRVGSIQIDAYIIGKLKSGKYAGLKTKLVET